MAYLPLIMTGVSIAALLFLVLKVRMPAFVALLLVSLMFGLSTGMAPGDIIDSVRNGMGGTLGFVAIVVGLGAMMGALLEVSGGVQAISSGILKRFGEGKAQWALGLIGFLVAIPVFFDVALIIMIPILFGLRERTAKPLIWFALPLMAGLAVTHSFIPPTPGPIAVAEILSAELGWVILFGALAGLPAMVIAGPMLANLLIKLDREGMRSKFRGGQADLEEPGDPDAPAIEPIGFGAALSVIMLPLVLILAGTLTGVVGEGRLPASAISVVGFVGHPFVALLITVLYAWYLFGIRKGFKAAYLHDAMLKALEPAGIVVLVTGAGGVFKQILVDSGGGRQLAEVLSAGAMPPIVFAFLVATIVRVAQGSATVAMITAAGLVAPVAELAGLQGAQLGLLVIAIASGATMVSHVNDSGFWLVSRYLGLTEAQTLKTWTVSTTLIGLTGFAVVLLLSLFF
ncbi:gluconate:H+ symporter [Aquisalinus flavus]|uniref:Gluconate transporter n=1 Tax=Aquisalinus flavus TaxID=1526572 RepID=A0A8J2Y725_9PROT|nr:gluconate:H+ symporter [Aquisalinus flavus]MBD0425237.1 gluconate transporter [Aquisalinus flavus]UNE49103.1 gluconate transporter [Aquisalinus flavus]GGD17644.1 gluconate transporter [Aquisalinus flavus]